MTLSCRTAVCRRRARVGGLLLGFVAVSVAGTPSGAQQADTKDPHRWSAAATVDVGGLPDAFGDQCGSGSVASYGGGLTALFRPRRWLVVAADVRASAVPDIFGCSLVLPAPVLIGPNEYENWASKQYPSGVAATPLVRTVLHVGAETPPGSPLLRATVGGGVIWTGSRTPVGTLTIGGGTRGRGARFYWEVETSACSLRVTEVHTRFRIDSNVSTPLPSRISSYVEHPRWTALHLGLEIPVASRP